MYKQVTQVWDSSNKMGSRIATDSKYTFIIFCVFFFFSVCQTAAEFFRQHRLRNHQPLFATVFCNLHFKHTQT